MSVKKSYTGLFLKRYLEGGAGLDGQRTVVSNAAKSRGSRASR